MVLLFALFPRMAPLWGLPQDAAGRTGLSGTLQMGGVAEIANDDSIAMRVRFFGRVPSADQLYFRGPVLGSFDGREWTRLTPSFPPPQRLRSRAAGLRAPVEYELTLEPSRLSLLPLLEMTPDRPDAAPDIEGFTLTLRSDVQWQLDRPVTERVRLRAKAWTEHRHGPRRDLLGLRDYVACRRLQPAQPGLGATRCATQPENAGADARRWPTCCWRMCAATSSPTRWSRASYGRDAVDEFWFDRKLGFCEHFAAAFVVMMRAMDVPARIVTGYQGTDPEPVDGYYIVRQSHAHAWAEYWQPAPAGCAPTPPRRWRPSASRSAATCSRHAAWWPTRWAASTRPLAQQLRRPGKR
jgi:hypothetical protein